jgi:acetyl esterase/lipase
VARPDHLRPFVLPTERIAPERHGHVDLYLAQAVQPCPAIVFIHGGPIRADLPLSPRDWPVYRGYGSLAASRGITGVTVDHRLYDPGDYPRAADDVAAAIQAVRADPRIDSDRIGLWFFSGGGLLVADWLRAPPDWLRCAAASYPLLAPLPGWSVDPRFRPAEAICGAGPLPIVLTSVGRERPAVAGTVEAFIAAARECQARLEVVDVPHGQHAFDVVDDTGESRQAIEQAFSAVASYLA